MILKINSLYVCIYHYLPTLNKLFLNVVSNAVDLLLFQYLYYKLCCTVPADAYSTIHMVDEATY